MTDDGKYTAMMREQERTSEKLARANWGHEHSNEAADWRAMREAWEAMVEALEWLDTPPHPIGSNAEYKHLAQQWAKAALQKARV